ncbi:tyrosine-type recombinase/integrase [Methylocystis sp. IM3]|uniref:tyrosine-type recombinase/integrase n=1 Tax=unclassified Methylocystis TaxID=2625913 RepID=UPI0030F81D72
MPRKRFPYVQEWTDKKTGRRYYFFRRPGFPRVPLPAPYGGDDFKHAYDLAMAGAPKAVGATRSPPGSMSALIASFYASAKFQALRPITAATYRNILERFRAEHGHKTVAGMQPKHVNALVDGVKRPHARKRLLNLLSLLMKHAIRTGLREDNPARDIEVELPKSEGFLSWTEEEIAQFRAHWELGTLPRLVLEIALNTGQRRGDLVRMGRQNIRDGKIHITQAKTGTAVHIPINGDLMAALASPPCRDFGPFLQTEKGASRSAAGLGNDFHDWVREAGIERPLTLHGFRKAAGRRLAEAECTAPQVMAILGHKSLKEAQRYIDAFNREKAGEAAMAKIEKTFGKG